MLSFIRESDGERLLVLANFDEETVVNGSAHVGSTELLTEEAVRVTLTLAELGLAVLELP